MCDNSQIQKKQDKRTRQANKIPGATTTTTNEYPKTVATMATATHDKFTPNTNCSCEWMNIFVNWKLDEWKIFDGKTKEPIPQTRKSQEPTPSLPLWRWKMSANKCAYNTHTNVDRDTATGKHIHTHAHILVTSVCTGSWSESTIVECRYGNDCNCRHVGMVEQSWGKKSWL